MLPRHIVWVGDKKVYECSDICKAYKIRDKYIDDGYNDVRIETIY